MIDEPTNLKVSAVFVLFQLVWQIVSLAYSRSTWVVLRKMHAPVENKDNPSAAVCDSYIVLDRARSCFGWLTCLRVIVWSGVCCASLVLALKYMSACSLLTLCLTMSGSYVKCACHKNTFHINLPDPLVETLALMNHDLSENESLFTGNSSIWRIVSSSSRLGTLFSASLEKASFAQWTIVHCSGSAADAVCCWEEYQVRWPMWCTRPAAQRGTESPWVARSWPDKGSFFISQHEPRGGKKPDIQRL